VAQAEKVLRASASVAQKAEAQREYGLTPDDVHDSFNLVIHTRVGSPASPESTASTASRVTAWTCWPCPVARFRASFEVRTRDRFATKERAANSFQRPSTRFLSMFLALLATAPKVRCGVCRVMHGLHMFDEPG
jgi:hypothetical protein